jgi:hypothetical protein
MAAHGGNISLGKPVIRLISVNYGEMITASETWIRFS